MHKNEFIRQVARESGLPQATVAQVLGAAVRVIGRALVAGQKVVWTGFGTFEVRRRSARQGINPQTRQRIIIGATRTPGFTASSTFKNRVVGPAGPARQARAGAREELEETGK
jgi:DNA-binding protein HU-beta